MNWKNHPPRHAGFYLASLERRGDHAYHWDGTGWSEPLDLRDCTPSALEELARSSSRSIGGVEWLCPALFADGMLVYPGGRQPVPSAVQVRVIHAGVMYQGHAGGYRHWAEDCRYMLVDPADAVLRDVSGLDAIGLLEASAQYMREGGPRSASAQDLDRVAQVFAQSFGVRLTDQHALAFLAAIESAGGSLPNEKRNKA